jgi:hypothetical protein
LGRPFKEYRSGDGYLYEHLGFNHRKLEKVVADYCIILEKHYSPFKFLGYNFNSQVFYKLKPK